MITIRISEGQAMDAADALTRRAAALFALANTEALQGSMTQAKALVDKAQKFCDLAKVMSVEFIRQRSTGIAD